MLGSEVGAELFDKLAPQKIRPDCVTSIPTSRSGSAPLFQALLPFNLKIRLAWCRYRTLTFGSLDLNEIPATWCIRNIPPKPQATVQVWNTFSGNHECFPYIQLSEPELRNKFCKMIFNFYNPSDGIKFFTLYQAGKLLKNQNLSINKQTWTWTGSSWPSHGK
jgi:hypothetical protein